MPPAAAETSQAQGAGTPPPGDATNDIVPDLRWVGADETRVSGTLGAIECGRDGIVVSVTVKGRS